MANLSQFQRGSTTYDLKALALKYIAGTGTAAKTSSPYCFSKWKADAPEITSLYNGLTILYKVPVAGNSKYGTCLQLNSLGYHPVVVQTSSHVSTRYGVGAMIMLAYNEGLSCSVYGTIDGANAADPASITGVWVVVNDYDANTNTLLRTYASATNIELPLVAASTGSTTPATSDYTSSYKDSYGQIPSTVANRATINLSTGELKAKQFTGDLEGLASQALADSAGNNIVNTYAKKSDLDALVAATDAMTFKGTLGTGGTITSVPASHTVGDTYKVITASTWAGQKCEVGDLLICITTSTTANNAHWTVAQTNIDGAVTGPTSATTSNFAAFNGTSGKIIQDSGYGPGDFSPSGHKHPFSDITDRPTTLSGYGITDAQSQIKLNGSQPLTSLTTTVASGVSGVYATFDNGSSDGNTLFFADGIGLNTVLNQVNTAIAAKSDSDHWHGYISDVGALTTTAALTTTDKLLFVDTSNDNKITATDMTAGTSTLLNSLGEGTSPAQMGDYIIAQYAGGGTSTKTYHRRKLSNILTATNIKTALGFTAADKAVYTTTSGAITYGALPIAAGGTGATSSASARTNLGLGTLATKSTIANHEYIRPSGTTTMTQPVGLNFDTVVTGITDGQIPQFGDVIPADDITAWHTNVPTAVTPNTVVTDVTFNSVVTGVTFGNTTVTSATVDGKTLRLTLGAAGSITSGVAGSKTTGASASVTPGTAANLEYTGKNIPNVINAGSMPTFTTTTVEITQPTFTVDTETAPLSHTIS